MHNNKLNPIGLNTEYFSTATYNSLEYTKIEYNLQFIKYGSDDGLIYQNSKFFKGISFSDMINYRITQTNGFNDSNEKEIGKITIGINKSNFDNYKRTYPRIQSLLADFMSVVNILFEIGRALILFLSKKKMSKDIIKYILYDKNKNFNNPIMRTESWMNIRTEKEEKENIP